MADSNGQLLLALYSTVTKSHLTDNRFDVQVILDSVYYHLCVLHFRCCQTLKVIFTHLALKPALRLVSMQCVPAS